VGSAQANQKINQPDHPAMRNGKFPEAATVFHRPLQVPSLDRLNAGKPWEQRFSQGAFCSVAHHIFYLVKHLDDGEVLTS
jgi:hypothetical protein